MSRRVYVHVGSPKTGTTFLQGVLWSQRERARAAGLLLPGSGEPDHFRASVDVCGGASARPDPERFSGAWRHLIEEVTAWPEDVLISHELFAPATADQAQTALAHLGDSEVHVVLTARDLARQITAEWQEHVKHRSTLGFGEFVTAVQRRGPAARWFWRVQDVVDILDRWGATLPRDQVHVVTVPPPDQPLTLLWERFCDLVGLDPAAFDLGTQRSNMSLSVEAAELLRRVNVDLGSRIPCPGREFDVFKGVFAHQVVAGMPGGRLHLDLDTTLWACEESARVVDWLQAAGVDVVGDLTDLVPRTDHAGSAAPGPSPDLLDDAAMLPLSTAALADVLTRFTRNRLRAERLEREVRELRELVERPARPGPLKRMVITASNRWRWAVVLRHGYRGAVDALRGMRGVLSRGSR